MTNNKIIDHTNYNLQVELIEMQEIITILTSLVSLQLIIK